MEAEAFDAAVVHFHGALRQPLFEQPNYSVMPHLVEAYLGAGQPEEARLVYRVMEIAFAIEFGIVRCFTKNSITYQLVIGANTKLIGFPAVLAKYTMCGAILDHTYGAHYIENLRIGCRDLEMLRRFRKTFGDRPGVLWAPASKRVKAWTELIDEFGRRALHAAANDPEELKKAAIRKQQQALKIVASIDQCRRDDRHRWSLTDRLDRRLNVEDGDEVVAAFCPAQAGGEMTLRSFEDYRLLCESVASMDRQKPTP